MTDGNDVNDQTFPCGFKCVNQLLNVKVNCLGKFHSFLFLLYCETVCEMSFVLLLKRETVHQVVKSCTPVRD